MISIKHLISLSRNVISLSRPRAVGRMNVQYTSYKHSGNVGSYSVLVLTFGCCSGSQLQSQYLSNSLLAITWVFGNFMWRPTAVLGSLCSRNISGISPRLLVTIRIVGKLLVFLFLFYSTISAILTFSLQF